MDTWGILTVRVGILLSAGRGLLLLMLLVGAAPVIYAADSQPVRAQTMGALAQQASAVRANADGTFSVDLELRMQNVGLEPLVEVQIINELATELAPATVVSIDNVQVTPPLTLLNDSFNGDTNVFMLPGTERLDVDDEAFLRYTLTFSANGNPGPFQVRAVFWAAGEQTGNGVDDVSQDGVDPDPDTPGNEPGDNPAPIDDFVPTPLPLPELGPDPDPVPGPTPAPVLGALEGTVFFDPNLDSARNAGEVGLLGWLIEVFDSAGQLIGSTTTDANGNYLLEDLPPGDYLVRISHPESQATWLEQTITVPAGGRARVDLPVVSSGRVYDSVTRELVPGVTLRVINATTGATLPAVCLLPGQQNQTVGADAAYRFDLRPGADPACPGAATDYEIVIVAAPAVYVAGPSVRILTQSEPLSLAACPPDTNAAPPCVVQTNALPPIGAEATNYFLQLNNALGDQTFANNHLPIDTVASLSNPGLLSLQKSTSARTVVVGDIVPYQLVVRNDTVAVQNDIVIRDDLPAGFVLVADSVQLTRAGADDVAGTPDDIVTALASTGIDPVELGPFDLAAGEAVRIAYFVRVGVGIAAGVYTNRAVAEQGGLPVSAGASAVVQITADPLFEQTTVIGKVFDDRDADGWQDSAAATRLVLSGGPFNKAFELPDIRGRKAASEPPLQIRTELPGVFNAPISLRSAEGSFVTLGLDGELRQSDSGRKASGQTAQRLVMRVQQDAGKSILIVENTGINESGIPGVRLATVDGLLIETDQFGRYHIADVATGLTARGANFILKLDPASLPDGSVVVSENPRVIRLTPSLMSRIDFAVGLPEPELLPAASPLTPEVLEVSTRMQRSDVRPVNFDTGKVRIPENYAAQLQQLLQEYRGRDNLQLTFVGHADPRPLGGALARKFRDNKGLSAARAKEVAEFAQSVLDVPESLVSHEGRGATQPVATNTTLEGMAANRRVEIEVSWTETTERRVLVADLDAPPKLGEQEVSYTSRSKLPSVRFRSGSLQLDAGSVSVVRRAIERFGTAAVRVEVTGHTDNVPLGEANAKRYGSNAALSLARAQTVADELQKRFELPADSITVRGKGAAEPLASNDSAEGRAANRRVELTLVTDQTERVSRSWVEPLQTAATDYLPHGGRIWATEQPLTVSPKLNVLATQDLLVDKNSREVRSLPTFTLYSNYNNFIGRKELRLYASGDTDRARALAVIPVGNEVPAIELDASVQSKLHEVLRVRSTQALVYVLRAYGTGDSLEIYDETTPRLLRVRAVRASAPLPATRDNEAAAVWGLDNLAHQNIPVQGSRVRVNGIDVGPEQTLVVEGEEVPVSADGTFIWERALPVGEHRLHLDLTDPAGNLHARELPVTVDGNYQFMVGLVNFAVGENNISGNTEPLSANDHFDEELFVDGRLAFYAKAKIKGKYLITAQLDSTEDELKNFGDNLRREDPRRLFRQLDPDRFYPVYGDDSTTTTDVDTQGAFYVRVDVHRSSLTWGNYNTGLNDTEFSQYNRSLYGGRVAYKSQATTQLGEAKRSLTLFGSEAQSSAASVTFRATGGSLYYLRHTDIVQGSEKVWIEVRRRDSEQVLEREILVEGRDYEVDDLQGRLILARPLAQVVNDRGTAIVRNSPLEGDNVFLQVDYEYVPTSFAADDKTAGGRGKLWLGEHVAVGATKVIDERAGTDYDLQGVDVTLQAGRGTYLRAEYVESESRQSQASFNSFDGGLSFVARDSAASTAVGGVGGVGIEGDALALEGRINLGEYSDSVSGDIRAWWKDRDAGFSTGRLAQGVETKDLGVDARVMWDHVRIDAGYSELDREGIGKDTVVRAQVEADLGRVTAGIEARYEDVERQQGVSVLSGRTGDGEALIVGARVGVAVSETTELYASGQVTADERGNYEDNDLISVGVNTQLSERAAVSVEVSEGDRGSAVIGGLQFAPTQALNLNLSGGFGSGATSSFGTSYSYGEGAEIYGSYAVDPDRTDGPRDQLTLGQRRQFGNHTSIFTESQFGKGDQYSSTGHTFGVSYSGYQDWLLSATLTSSDNDGVLFAGNSPSSLDGQLVNFERLAASIGARLERNSYRFASRVEFREDQADGLHTRQYLTSNTFGWQRSAAGRVLGKLNLSWTDDELTDERSARFVEFDLGYAYRPVWSNRLNLLGRYSFLYDLPSLGQGLDPSPFASVGAGVGSSFGGLAVNRTDQRSHIFSLEALFAANSRWEFGAKLALKRGEQRFDRDAGDWETFGLRLFAARTRYHLTNEWDGLLEYRWLSDWEGDGVRHGAIAGIYRHLGGHLKIGGGYNFAGFDDDLKFNDFDSHGWFIDLIGKY